MREILVDLQNLILEMVARGTELRAVMDRLCREVEQLAPGTTCSILSVDDDGRLHTLAAPSLPKSYNQAVEGLHIGERVGSCGTAAFRGTDVVVTSIAHDPLWQDFQESPIPANVAACWSSPIIADGRVLGTFAFYYAEQRGPTDFEREIVAQCIHLCGIAFERDHRLHENQRLLYTDHLTGLRNRLCFEERVARPLENGEALLLIDIDELKMVNDTFGHTTGDCLIQVVSDRVREASGKNRSFRVGGDELAVLTDPEEMLPLAERILGLLRDPADCCGNILLPSATIGAAVRSIDDPSGAVMRQNADLALYHGKEDGGRGSLSLYTPDLRSRMHRRLRAIDELRRAIAEQRIEAHYQPIVDLDDDAVRGFEALVRIRDADGHIIPAFEFQEAFADARNAVEVTRLMLRAVAGDVRRWMDLGLAVPRIGVNLSPMDFGHGRLVPEIREIFSTVAAPLDRLALEVTESVYLGRRDVMVQKQMEALRHMGVRLALDDFGTGFASLTHLLVTPVHTLKIDKSFVDTLGEEGDIDSGGAAVIDGLIRMAEKLNMIVVAEGIETIGQRERLRTLGCKLGQGFLFAAALPGKAAEQLLKPVHPGGVKLLPTMSKPVGAGAIRAYQRRGAARAK